MTDLSAFAELSARDHGLVVLNTLRGDGSIQSSVVNAGVMPHPTTGDPVVALVAIGSARKLRNLRSRPAHLSRRTCGLAVADGRGRSRDHRPGRH